MFMKESQVEGAGDSCRVNMNVNVDLAWLYLVSIGELVKVFSKEPTDQKWFWS